MFSLFVPRGLIGRIYLYISPSIFTVFSETFRNVTSLCVFAFCVFCVCKQVGAIIYLRSFARLSKERNILSPRNEAFILKMNILTAGVAGSGLYGSQVETETNISYLFS